MTTVGAEHGSGVSLVDAPQSLGLLSQGTTTASVVRVRESDSVIVSLRNPLCQGVGAAILGKRLA